MRILNANDIFAVAGGDPECESGGGTVTAGTDGVNVTSDTDSFGDALVDIYEGAVAVTSHVIERVAEAL